MLLTILKYSGVGIGAMLAYLLLLDGLVGEAVYRHAPTITWHEADHQPANGYQKFAVVYLTGAQSQGDEHAAPLLDLWRRYGDVLVVNYDRHAFDRDVIRSVDDALRDGGYTHVYVIGASMGALLAAILQQRSDRLYQMRLILPDPVSQIDDLKGAAGAEVMAWWHAGPVANLLLTRPFWHFGWNPPARETLGPDVDDKQLAAHYAATRRWPLSGWTDSLRFIRDNAVLHRMVLATGVVIRSQYDDVVLPKATDRWKQILGPGFKGVVTAEGAGHIDFVEHPHSWRTAFAEAFELVAW